MEYIVESQFINNFWITYHKNKPTTNKMQGLMSLMFNFPDFCMNNRLNCKSVCKSCYAFIQTSIRGRSLWPKLKHNTNVFENGLIHFNKFESPLNVLRFSSYGELSSMNQLLNIILTAKYNSHLSCAIWSKRYNYISKVKHLLPSNLITVWSASQINSMTFTIPQGFIKSFYVYKNIDALQKAKEKATMEGFKVVECQKLCKECLVCYKDHTPSIVMELLK